ncbi:MAG TPA: hypothetical protein VGU66_12330 [Candidatus Elarobacter sp.]|nr:hypothetical protein [Candidatus Elarobacter sp.]
MKKVPFVALALAIVTGCSGGGQTLSPTPLHSCPAFLGGSVTDPAVQPPDGAHGVSPSIGSIVVPFTDGLAGHTAVLIGGPPGTANQTTIVSLPFVPSGPNLTATIPALAAQTTYSVSADVLVSAGTGPLGCDVVRLYVLGSFTTQ